ncbi:MAG TPA: hypothetical protein PLA94_31520, partial [Myxococcota bacterium]|nr:hypothetical protein [Myxococcota bacterium]
MRSAHLLGLRPKGELPRLYLQQEGPLVLPAFLDPVHHEQIVQFYHLAVAPLAQRVEIDWYGDLRPAQVRMLERMRLDRGAEGVLVLVRVEESGQDL